MEIQADELMTGAEVLERIRTMRPGTFIVPRDGFERKRAIALKLGVDRLGGYQSAMNPRQLAELDAYGTIIDGLVEAGYLLVQDEKPYLLGRAGVMDQDVFGYDVVYVIPDPVPTSNDPVRSADDLLELIKEEGRFVYTASFERGEVAGFTSTIARYSGEDDTQIERLLKFATKLERSGLITVEINPYVVEKAADRVRRAGGLPSTTLVLRAA